MHYPRSMKSALCGVALLTVALPALAAGTDNNRLPENERTRHEVTGVLSGVVIGGLVGGPIGAVVSAGFGAWVGDLTVARKEKDLMAQSLADQQQELVALQAEYRALEARYQVASREVQTARARTASFEAQPLRNANGAIADSELSLHFKSGSAQIESHYDQKLQEFATLMKTRPNAKIEITGYADRRGESAANLALSQRRIKAVEERLRDLGVTNRALQTSAFGESRPVTDNDTLENNFFDRRVIVKVVAEGNGLLTRSNN